MYLLDSDVAKKICQYQLLHELVDALGCGLEGFAVLPQLRFQLKLSNQAKAIQKLGSKAAVDLARQLVAHAVEVEIAVEAANPMLGLNRPDIDSGEATLFAALYDNDKGSLISGDKRAFIALAQVDGLPVVDALWARLICIEEAMHHIVQTASFDTVSAKIRAMPGVDTAISIAFGRVNPNPQAVVLDALMSYINDLQCQTAGKYVLP